MDLEYLIFCLTQNYCVFLPFTRIKPFTENFAYSNKLAFYFFNSESNESVFLMTDTSASQYPRHFEKYMHLASN